MRRAAAILAVSAVCLTAAACSSPRTVPLPATAPAPTAAALEGRDAGGELADARDALDSVRDGRTAARRPDLVAVAEDGLACWREAALNDAPLSPEAAACRTDFWGAVHAMTPADANLAAVP
jgi:hypothetical protein